jgi:hypothetical protein
MPWRARSTTGCIVDADVDILPTHPAVVALSSAIAGDAVANLIEFAELFDVDMDELPGLLTLVTTERLGWFKCTQPVEPEPAKEPGLRLPERSQVRLRSACRCSADDAKLRRQREWPVGFGLAMKGVLRIDLATHLPLPPGSGWPTSPPF